MFDLFKKKNIEIKSINIKFNNSIHTLDSKIKKFNSKNIIISIPFRNNINNVLNVNKIIVEPPFIIKEIHPEIPIKLKTGESIEIKLFIVGPDYSYSGPINLEMD
ncbi:MAG: hypothetical protein ACP5UN_02095 [Candidatus Micrarchaeia archaeon]